jgi:hypothetical protein
MDDAACSFNYKLATNTGAYLTVNHDESELAKM